MIHVQTQNFSLYDIYLYKLFESLYFATGQTKQIFPKNFRQVIKDFICIVNCMQLKIVHTLFNLNKFIYKYIILVP